MCKWNFKPAVGTNLWWILVLMSVYSECKFGIFQISNAIQHFRQDSFCNIEFSIALPPTQHTLRCVKNKKYPGKWWRFLNSSWLVLSKNTRSNQKYDDQRCNPVVKAFGYSQWLGVFCNVDRLKAMSNKWFEGAEKEAAVIAQASNYWLFFKSVQAETGNNRRLKLPI
jgi:hypothetical protein